LGAPLARVRSGGLDLGGRGCGRFGSGGRAGRAVLTYSVAAAASPGLGRLGKPGLGFGCGGGGQGRLSGGRL
jgi:hypothetical protein